MALTRAQTALPVFLTEERTEAAPDSRRGATARRGTRALPRAAQTLRKQYLPL